MPTAWRILKARHAERAFDGEGARLYGGRWNPTGTRAVYLAESRALALLEVLVHLGESAPLASYVAIGMELDPDLVERIDEASLPDAWWISPAPIDLQAIGSEWLASRRSLWLSVPSAIVPAERLYVLNPEHELARELVPSPPEPLRVDPRLPSAPSA